MFQCSESGADASTVSGAVMFPNLVPKPEQKQESVGHLVFGSVVAVRTTITRLYQLNYAEPHEWSKPIPTEQSGEVMVVLTKRVVRS